MQDTGRSLHVFLFCFWLTGMGNGMDPSSMGPGDFGQLGDPTQFLSSNDLISQRSSPDFMPGGQWSQMQHESLASISI